MKGYKSILDVDECILYLDCDIVSWVYAFVKTQQIVHCIYVQFTEYQLCLRKAGFLKDQRKNLE